MYVKDMTMDAAILIRDQLRGQLRMQSFQGRTDEQLEWDLEDVLGRIDELTDWY